VENKIGKYTVSQAEYKSLTELAKNIDGNPKELSSKEKKVLTKTLNSCKGDVKLAEAMLRRIIVEEIITPEMVKIPAGTWKVKDDNVDRNVRTTQKAHISAFNLGKYEVTNKEYLNYLVATAQKVPPLIEDPSRENYPVVNITWNDAVKFCEWLSKSTGRAFRLPTEVEWKYAAGFKDDQTAPIKIDPNTKMPEAHDSTPRSVDSPLNDKNKYGVYGLHSNVWEWMADDAADPNGLSAEHYGVLRGALDQSTNDVNLRDVILRKIERRTALPEQYFSRFGFRVAEDLK
jgi:formylglycine-generating enzyme required for sulfatase activity